MAFFFFGVFFPGVRARNLFFVFFGARAAVGHTRSATFFFVGFFFEANARVYVFFVLFFSCFFLGGTCARRIFLIFWACARGPGACGLGYVFF